jgi:hypothetical protein
MPLIIYMKTATNKRLLISESHGDSNRIHPTGETPTNMLYASHAQSAYGLETYVSYAVNA